ncbi:hypothetical protein NXY31_04030 [Bacteroides salyersiae]|nr:hypothetical protein [Bacteroides salyersiae]
MYKQAIALRIPFEILLADDASCENIRQQNRKMTEWQGCRYLQQEENQGLHVFVIIWLRKPDILICCFWIRTLCPYRIRFWRNICKWRVPVGWFVADSFIRVRVFLPMPYCVINTEWLLKNNLPGRETRNLTIDLSV